ncbi:MAG: NAD(P)/FAD-dependent oxidoreductase, partial [Candidatus Omnitrophica bacterium]|nr:NAD(P)/FAD-dependent oxidoreductase [Candidatus Omnitrophota bacterium]
IGGLTAGAILARNGKKVLVLEKNPVAGGYAVNFRRGEFEFDASLHLLNGFGKGKISYRFLEEAGIDEKIEFIRSPYLYRSIFPDFDIRLPQCNPEAYIELLAKFFPSEIDKVKELFKLMYRIFCRIYEVSGDRISPGDFTKYIGLTYQDVLNEFSLNDKLVAIISQVWPFNGLPPKQLPFFSFLVSFCDYVYNGGYYPKGGGQAIADALVAVIRENGGAVVFKKPAEQVLIKNGVAYGILSKDRDVFLGNKIICNIDARTVFHKLIGAQHLNHLFLKKIDEMEPSISAFQVYLGLSVDLTSSGLIDYTIFLNYDYNLEKHYQDSVDNKMDKSPLEISIYSLLTDNKSSKNRSIVNIISLAGYDFWKNIPKELYKDKKEELANILIKRAEAVIPKLSSSIDTMEVATPLTMERYTGNYKGAIYGWSPKLAQFGVRRMGQKTPIKNLFLCGAWTKPAGGIAGVMQSGVILSNKILNGDY